jgi:hypothetical protein
MKKLIFLALTIATTVFAAEPQLPGGNKPIQQFAPDGSYNRILSVASVTMDLSDNLMYACYSGSGTCYLRLMPTSAKAGMTQVLIPNAVWLTYAKNPATPFVNMSGCVAGYFQRQ